MKKGEVKELARAIVHCEMNIAISKEISAPPEFLAEMKERLRKMKVVFVFHGKKELLDEARAEIEEEHRRERVLNTSVFGQIKNVIEMLSWEYIQFDDALIERLENEPLVLRDEKEILKSFKIELDKLDRAVAEKITSDVWELFSIARGHLLRLL